MRLADEAPYRDCRSQQLAAMRGLALPVAIGRPIVSRAIAGARGGKSPSLRLHVRSQGAGVPTEGSERLYRAAPRDFPLFKPYGDPQPKTHPAS